MHKRYIALSAISFLFKVLAVIITFGGITFVVITLAFENLISNPSFSFLIGTPGAIITMLASLIIALILWAFGELIVCFMDIEYNTRTRTISDSQTKITDTVQADGTPIELTPNSQPKQTDTTQAKLNHDNDTNLSGRKQNIKDILNKKLW